MRAPRRLKGWIGGPAEVLIPYPDLNGSLSRADASVVMRILRLACVLLIVARATAGATGSGESPRLPSWLLSRALEAFTRVEAAGRVRNRLLTVIDYALPSSQRRLWVLEPDSRRVLFHEFVAHGKGSAPESNPDRAAFFGNQPGSLRSSLGTFLTGDPSFSGFSPESLSTSRRSTT